MRFNITTTDEAHLTRYADRYATNDHGDLLLFNASQQAPVATVNRDRWLAVEPEGRA